MMQRIGILFFIVLCPLFGLGQFEYFNQVIGVEGDSESEGTPDIELLEDGYMVWGGGVNSDEFYFLRKLDSNGTILAEHRFGLEDGFIYVGAGSNFSFHEGFGFLSRAHVGSLGTRGLAMKSNENLDTLWLKYYQLYDDYTYFFTHTPFSDGYAIAGEYGLAPGERGTFIAMLDTAGQVLWHQSIHAPSEGVFRNRDISAFEDGFIVSGASGTGGDTEGRIEKLDAFGNLEHSFETNQTALFRGVMRHFINAQNEIIVSQYIAYEDYLIAPGSLVDYSLMQLYRLDVESLALIPLGTYFDNHEWITGGAVKLINGLNGSTIVMGNTSTEVGNNLNYISFILSLDSSFNLEWYTELAYDPCLTCTNTLYDLEVAPDGGYVMVGKFDNQDDPYDKTWLVKVDACGDLEWQGCAGPNGIQDWEIQDSRLEIFPNPVSGDEINIRFPREEEVERVQIIDGQGSEVCLRLESLRFEVSAHSETNFKLQTKELQTLPPGLYSLLITTRDGDVYSGKVVIE